MPLVLPSHVWGAGEMANSRITVGFIGMGMQSQGLMQGFLGTGADVVAVCDVDTKRRDHALQKVNEHYQAKGQAEGRCKAYEDYREVLGRKDIDAVCVATPDHWHAIITIEALEAGKDVYCEKPLTHNIREALLVMKAAKKHKRILQTGSMQRSMKEFRVACELVRNGVIGRIEKVECSFGDPGILCDLPGEEPEPGLNWDRWLGPAPARAYNSILSPRGVHKHFPDWRNYMEYGGGMVTDWGAHHLDIAQWGLGMDDSGPVEVVCPPSPGAKRGAKLVYENGVTVEHKDGFGVVFFGSEGEVKVNRGRFVFSHGDEEVASTELPDTACALEVRKAEDRFLKDAKVRLYASQNHIKNFLDCMRSRQRPITDERTGAHSVICCHLMNIVYLHGQDVRWNPKGLAFAKKSGDPAWLTREYRKPWKV